LIKLEILALLNAPDMIVSSFGQIRNYSYQRN